MKVQEYKHVNTCRLLQGRHLSNNVMQSITFITRLMHLEIKIYLV